MSWVVRKVLDWGQMVCLMDRADQSQRLSHLLVIDAIVVSIRVAIGSRHA